MPWSGSGLADTGGCAQKGCVVGFSEMVAGCPGARPPGERQSVGGVLSLGPGSPYGSLMMSELPC